MRTDVVPQPPMARAATTKTPIPGFILAIIPGMTRGINLGVRETRSVFGRL
jgi:hypothetical protein